LSHYVAVDWIAFDWIAVEETPDGISTVSAFAELVKRTIAALFIPGPSLRYLPGW
jgi:hypothetical protein